MPRRVAITGISGQLGGAFQRLAPADWEILGASSATVDITSWAAVRDWITVTRPQLVIHAAAMTDVDGCEHDSRRAFRVNALGTRNVAVAAARVGATLVYVSTNFVFDGAKASPYHEFDDPGPISVYGQSKLAGEREAYSHARGAYVVRTAMLFDEGGRNFVNTMRRVMAEREQINVVSDQVGNPTYALDLASGVVQIVDRCPPGTYHLTNSGVASWFDWASEIRRLCGLDCDVLPIPASEYERAATPPMNGAMVALTLEDFGIQLPAWQDALARCLG